MVQPLQPSSGDSASSLLFLSQHANLLVFPLQLPDSLGSQLCQAHLQKRSPLEQSGYGRGVTTPQGQCLLLQETFEAHSLMGALQLKTLTGTFHVTHWLLPPEPLPSTHCMGTHFCSPISPASVGSRGRQELDLLACGLLTGWG